MHSAQQIQHDFDRLAVYDDGGWNHNNHYHQFLLDSLPGYCGRALDVGCGAGAFTRLLADRSTRVLGVDLSPRMVEIAQQRLWGISNASFKVADIMATEFAPSSFDSIVSIATLHHLPLRDAIVKMVGWLRPGGTLAILDLVKLRGMREMLFGALGFPASRIARMMHGAGPESAEARELWEEHGAFDVYPTMAEVRAVADELLPKARVTLHVLWRYSLIWHKPLPERTIRQGLTTLD
jgi:SAM-dependent methyltransferase